MVRFVKDFHVSERNLKMALWSEIEPPLVAITCCFVSIPRAFMYCYDNRGLARLPFSYHLVKRFGANI